MKKTIFCLALAVMMLLAAIPAYADGIEESNYSYNGGCKKFFTTDGYISKTSNQSWYKIVADISSITFQDPSNGYAYCCMYAYSVAGTKLSDKHDCYVGSNEQTNKFSPRSGINFNDYNLIRLQIHHPYYASTGNASTNKMQVVGMLRGTRYAIS